jgi:hypothetical protein
MAVSRSELGGQRRVLGAVRDDLKLSRWNGLWDTMLELYVLVHGTLYPHWSK